MNKMFSVQWWLDCISEAQLRGEYALIRRERLNLGIAISDDKDAREYRHYEDVVEFCGKRIIAKITTLQSAHDNLNEALELCADDVDTYACHQRFGIDEDELKGMKARHIAQLYLTPEEVEVSDE